MISNLQLLEFGDKENSKASQKHTFFENNAIYEEEIMGGSDSDPMEFSQADMDGIIKKYNISDSFILEKLLIRDDYKK